MTHSSNALQINETYESIKFYIPKILTATRTLKTKLTTIEAAATTTAIVETPVTATTIITNYNNVTNLLKRDLSNSTNNVGNSGKQDNDIYNDFNYNNDCMKLNQNYHESVDNEVEHAFKLSSPALGLKKIEIEATTASIAGKKAVTPTIAITTKTTKTKKTESCHHNKKAASQINSASISSKSSGNSEGYTSTNFNALDNDNDYDNDNVNVNEINDKFENDIYSNDSLESLSLDTYSSTSTTAEVADTTITTNTTLILESCCSKKSLPPNERVEDTNALKEDGKKRNTKLDNNSIREGAMSCSSSASSTSSTSFSTNVAVDNAAVTTVSASSKYQNITNKSPMYIIKIQTIQLKQTLASAHKRKAQNKNRKKSIANPSTSTSTSSKGLKRAQTSVQPSLSSAINHTTTKTTTTATAATTTTTTTIIGVVNGDSAELGDGNDPSDKAMDVAGNNKNKLRQLCPMPYQSNALNEKQLSSFGMANVHKRTLSSSSYRSGLSHYSVHTVNSATLSAKASCKFWNCLRWLCIWLKNSGIGEPSVHHALVVIFLEFFAWGLLTMPVIAVLNQTFPDHTFLMNGLVMGIKGILSFLSAPLIGALSDIWGRKFFLLITVFFTCAPIPLMTINTWWFFAMISISGIFAVTFSVVFAYVADVTTVEGRSKAYGLVSATFAASLVISPALGAALMEKYSDTLVVALATAIAVLDVFFILVAVPESLPDKVRPSSWGAPINWEQADPFAALRKVGSDHTILMQCVTVLLSYLPEAGQYSCIFVYLKLKMSFNTMEVAIFIAVVGILSISVQVTLGYLMRKVGAKQTIILGLILEMTQLFWYGFGSQKWMMWAAGILAALGSVTYPAISAFVSIHSTADSQGAVQGMVTGMRGLCNGLGPAMFGIIFYLFNVDLNDEHALIENAMIHAVSGNASSSSGGNNGSAGGGSGGGGGTGAGGGGGGIGKWLQMPGPPFIFGGFMVILAILVALFIPEYHNEFNFKGSPIEKKRISLDVQYEIECGPTSTSPLMHSDSLAQL